jgi:hypothetical protein
MQRKVRIGNYLSCRVPIKENGLKQGDDLLPIYYLFCSTIYFRKDWILVLTYAEDVSLIGNDMRSIERNPDVLSNSCKDFGLAINI